MLRVGQNRNLFQLIVAQMMPSRILLSWTVNTPWRVGGLVSDREKAVAEWLSSFKLQIKILSEHNGHSRASKSNDNRKQQQVNLRVANDEFYHSTTPAPAPSIINRSRAFFVFNFKLNFLVELSLRFIINAFRTVSKGNNRGECRFVVVLRNEHPCKHSSPPRRLLWHRHRQRHTHNKQRKRLQ